MQDRALCRDLLPHGISRLFSLATKERPPFPIQVPISPFNPSMLLSSNRQAKWLHLLRSGISEQSKQIARKGAPERQRSSPKVCFSCG